MATEIEGLVIRIVSDLVPAMQELVRVVDVWAKAMVDWWESLPEETKQAYLTGAFPESRKEKRKELYRRRYERRRPKTRKQ